jgi:hypothetical protein
MLTPLTKLTGKCKFIWELRHQAASNQMIIWAMLNYPDHHIPFEIYTDVSDYQLGSVIMQNRVPHHDIWHAHQGIYRPQESYLP